MRTLVVALGVVAALAISPAAWACTIDPNGYNPYVELTDSRPEDLYRRAGFVDWVRLEGGDTAVVLERLKGRSPGRYRLVRESYEPTDPPEFQSFYGFPVSPDTSPVLGLFSLSQKAKADEGHRALRFWDNGGVGMQYLGLDSCGGPEGFEPRMRYVVFRAINGAVLGYTPVLHEDDELLTRLRRRGVERTALERRIPVADFFRRADSVSLARVKNCPHSIWEDRANVTVLRGGLGDADPFDDRPRPPGPDQNYGFLHDFFAARKQACPAGRDILAFRIRMPGVLVQSDPAWARRSVRGLQQVSQLNEAEFSPNEPLTLYWDPGLPRAVIVANGAVRLADIPTGLKLIGPDSVSVEDAFRWSEEGAAARAKRPELISSRTVAPRQDAEPWPSSIWPLLAVIAAVAIAGFLAIARWGGRRRGTRTER